MADDRRDDPRASPAPHRQVRGDFYGGQPDRSHRVRRNRTEKLTGVEVRPDGLVHLERETGWAVIDPGEVVALVWDSEPKASAGQFL